MSRRTTIIRIHTTTSHIAVIFSIILPLFLFGCDAIAIVRNESVCHIRAWHTGMMVVGWIVAADALQTVLMIQAFVHWIEI